MRRSVGLGIGSPIENADLLYEYFPLSVDDWYVIKLILGMNEWVAKSCGNMVANIAGIGCHLSMLFTDLMLYITQLYHLI